jgi:hypothetical protein
MKISNNKFEKIILTELFHKHQRSRYLVNINPKYEKVIQLFKKKNEFKLLQHTYELSIKDRIKR